MGLRLYQNLRPLAVPSHESASQESLRDLNKAGVQKNYCNIIKGGWILCDVREGELTSELRDQYQDMQQIRLDARFNKAKVRADLEPLPVFAYQSSKEDNTARPEVSLRPSPRNALREFPLPRHRCTGTLSRSGPSGTL